MTRIESKVEKDVAIKKTALASESSFLANLAATRREIAVWMPPTVRAKQRA